MYIGKEVITFRYCCKMRVPFSFGGVIPALATFTERHGLASFPGPRNSCHRTVGRIEVLKESQLMEISVPPHCKSAVALSF